MNIHLPTRPIAPRFRDGRPYWVALVLLGLITLTACSDHGLPPGIVTPGIDQDPPPTPPTDTHKRIALLCMLANVNYDLVAPSEQALSQNTLKINELLQTNADVRAYLGTDWQVVWGPALANSLKKSSVSAPDSFVTDNTMYVARGTDLATGKPLYVVATSGTNAVSQKDARFEDFNINKEQDWGARKTGKISAGSALGFSILSAMTDAATGKTLLEFLATLGGAGPTQVAFTGHSLGGALSPLMALHCIEWQQQMGYTNLNVSVYPIAGPTPGNTDFATYAAQTFGEGYHSVINANDLVPHAWQKDMFAKIPSLYKNAPPFNPGGNGGFGLTRDEQLSYDSLRVVVEFKTYQRIAPEREFVFSGTPNVYADGSGSFFKEAQYQHVLAYYKEAFGFPPSIMAVLAN